MKLYGALTTQRQWTEAEIEAVRLCYRCCDRKILAAHLNRSLDAVRSRVTQMGLLNSRRRAVSKIRYRQMLREESSRMEIDAGPALRGDKRLVYAVARARVYSRLINKYTMISIGRAAGKHHTTILYALRQLPELEQRHARRTAHVQTDNGKLVGEINIRSTLEQKRTRSRDSAGRWAA